MSPQPDEAQPTLAHVTRRVLNHTAVLATLVVRAALIECSRPGIRFTSGVPAEVDPRPHHGSTSAPPHTFRSLEATVNGTTRMAITASSLFLLAACTAQPSTTTTEHTTAVGPSSATDPAEAARSGAVAAYREMWSAFVIAAGTSDWQSPALGQHSVGIALTKLTEGLRRDRDRGVVTRGEPTHDISVSSVEPSVEPKKVVVRDCSDSSNALKYRVDNGERSGNAPGGRQRIDAIVEKQSDGTWKVSDFGVHEVGSCDG